MELNELNKIPISKLSYSQSRSHNSIIKTLSNNQNINNNNFFNNNNNINNNNNNQDLTKMYGNSYDQQDSNHNGYFQEIPIGLSYPTPTGSTPGNNNNNNNNNNSNSGNNNQINSLESDSEPNGANIKPSYSVNAYPNNFVQPYYQTDKIFVINGMGNPTAAGGNLSNLKYSKFAQISENFTFILRMLVFPMIAVFFSVLLPLSKPYGGFLLGWEYTIMYIPVITCFISFFIVGWAQIFCKGIKSWLLPMAIHILLVSVTFSCITQYSESYPPPVVIGVSYGMSASVLPALLYLKSAERFNWGFFIDFLHFMLFMVIVIATIFLCVTFVIFFSLIEAQTLVMLVFFFKVFMCNQALLWITRKYCPVNQHNIITYWTESISEMTFCWAFSRFTKINFLVLILLRVVVMFRYLFFLSDKYWNLRTQVKDHHDRTRQNSWISTVNSFEKPYYTILGQLFPIEMERNEHMTRVVDRVLYTFISYCSVPLIYILFAVCLRFSYNAKFYPFDISIEAFMLDVIYAFFSSFLSYMIFLVIRYLFQVKYDISLLNHPIQIFRKNTNLLMFSNFNAFIIPITFVLMHNNVYYLVNTGESLYYN
ncbi:hypothetical protein DDB_G0290107 [Dictyostelium discoideum AX4]|uniref:Transmembrane protein n=1 Tax=Dictyostelium discoideum TaxID=44689 RepID=Q54GK2_DICDI|nr:hypothetical protein DDB_G0290107 [Dictyostelium discoideum AX4]EAL62392.1 hypothetical protein DDB_G0290107 [Dictyostelium discoideum AX4]|eukprot:XP_635893.1 hypothetical protein DDB_G0290107 [Dictyostelium discoideum AX4]